MPPMTSPETIELTDQMASTTPAAATEPPSRAVAMTVTSTPAKTTPSITITMTTAGIPG